MTPQINRRDVLRHGLGAAGLLAGRGLARASAAEQNQPQRRLTDRSEDAPSVPVAIQRCASYEPQELRRKVDTALDQIGGIERLVRGKTVTIKLNITGGPNHQLGGLPSYRTYTVHPNLVAALCAALNDAGARRIVIVEGQYTREAPEEMLTGGGWDVAAIKSAGGHHVTFEDTRSRGRWPKYSRLKVDWGGFIFPAFDLNPCYEKTDVFISLAKMKDHANAGITLAAKNLFGITPTSLYGDGAPNEDAVSPRGAIFHRGDRQTPDGVPREVDHGQPKQWSVRVPRITADTLGARPVDLAVIDGIETNRGGEGPWIKGVQPIQPHLLLAGLNAVCTDAVSAAAMGYDPMADHRQFPFMGENHLKLLASVGVGTNDVERIEVAGLPLPQAVHPFNPKRLKVGEPLFSSSPGCKQHPLPV